MNTIGDRLTYCRSTLGMTRKELCDDWGEISVPTLSRWELDTTKIPIKKAQYLIEYFQDHGLNVTLEWLLTNLGESPYIVSDHLLPSCNNFDIQCQKAFLELSKNRKNFTFHEVKGNFFSPIIRHGDYIAGINIDYNNTQIDNDKVYFVISDETYVGFCTADSKYIRVKNHLGTSKNILLSTIKKLGIFEWFAKRP